MSRALPAIAAAWAMAAALPLHAAPPRVLDPAAVQSVKLERSSCYGSCPAYWVEASRDGKVSFFSDSQYVKAKVRGERQAGRIGADAFGAMAAKAAEVRFLALDDRYVPGEPGCFGHSTDHSFLTITVRLADGAAKTVRYYQGCSGPPALKDIEALADEIDTRTNSVRWVGKP